MQLLLLQLGGQQYALETRQVVRVLPAMRLTVLPRAPTFIAGIMNYHGTPVAVLDLKRLCTLAGIASGIASGIESGFESGIEGDAAAPVGVSGAPATTSPTAEEIWFDTRIVLVEATSPTQGLLQLGLLAEHVTGIRVVEPAAIVGSGIVDERSPFLGKVVADTAPLLQLIDVARLLPAEVLRWLGGRMAESTC